MTQQQYAPVRRHFKPIKGFGLAASVLIGLAALSDVLSAWSDWHTHGVIADYLNDVPGVGEADLAAADSLAVAVALPGFLVLVAAGTVFLVWLWRARINSEVLYGQEGHSRQRAWAIWGWFVPVVGFWFPYQVVRDVHRPSTRLPGGVVVWWWGFLVAQMVFGRLLTVTYGTGKITVDNLDTTAQISTLTAALSVVAAALVVVVVIRQVTEGQLVPRADAPVPSPAYYPPAQL